MEEEDVVSSENFEGKHISTFLLTPHEHECQNLSSFTYLGLFGSVVAIAFRAEMHQNNIFLFFKNHF